MINTIPYQYKFYIQYKILEFAFLNDEKFIRFHFIQKISNYKWYNKK